MCWTANDAAQEEMALLEESEGDIIRDDNERAGGFQHVQLARIDECDE